MGRFLLSKRCVHSSLTDTGITRVPNFSSQTWTRTWTLFRGSPGNWLEGYRRDMGQRRSHSMWKKGRFLCGGVLSRYLYYYTQRTHSDVTEATTCQGVVCVLFLQHAAVTEPSVWTPSAGHQYRHQGEKIPPAEHGSVV